MGPEFWKPQASTKLKKCSEKKTPACSDGDDGCCAVVPCEYCLEFAVPDQTTLYGLATESEGQWTGTIAGISFIAYWERNYETGVCEFVVTLDGAEVYRNNCGGLVTCRDSSGSAEVFIYPDTGMLSWTKKEFRPLEYVIDPDTNCRTWFCGDCECTCQALCVTVTLPEVEPPVEFDPYECDGLLPICGMCQAIPTDLSVHGELNDTALPCDGPDFEGTVADITFKISLRRDSYGECVLSGTARAPSPAAAENLEEKAAGGCKSLAATWTLYDGTIISVACKICDCETDPPPDISDCCDSVPCTYCVTLECYGEDPITVDSDYLNGTWGGTVDGNTFSMYWTRDEYDECVFVVEFNGEIIYSKSIAEGQSCENNSDSIPITIGYDDCTLTWSKYEPRPLPHIVDPESYEIVPFCGTTSCTCECLCVTVTDDYGNVSLGEICDTAYDLCEAPVWEGTVGGREISLTVVRDRVGVCVMVPVIDGEQQDDYVVEVTGDFFPYTIQMYDGTTITMRCKVCSCEEIILTPCCADRCFPGAPGLPGNCSGGAADNPLPTTLTVEMTTDSYYGCFSGSTTVTLAANGRWGSGQINATCVWLDPTDSTKTSTWNFCVLISIQCTGDDVWGIEFRRCSSETYPYPLSIPADSSLTRISCDPILLEGDVCYDPFMSSVVLPITPPQPPERHPVICLSFLVYETP